jgi:hypothetical protein
VWCGPLRPKIERGASRPATGMTFTLYGVLLKVPVVADRPGGVNWSGAAHFIAVPVRYFLQTGFHILYTQKMNFKCSLCCLKCNRSTCCRHSGNTRA